MSSYQIRQLADEIQPSESGKQNVVLLAEQTANVIAECWMNLKSTATIMQRPRFILRSLW